VNYLVRQRVSTHVTTAIVEHLPVPREEEAPGAFQAIARLARTLGRLPSGSDRPEWALLNAQVARLYALTREELAHVLSTFPLVARTERDAALRAFEADPSDG
jgi:hypothetical protein